MPCSLAMQPGGTRFCVLAVGCGRPPAGLLDEAMRFALMLWLTVVASMARAAVPSVEIGWTEQQSAMCTRAIGIAEQRQGTPPGLLGAIARAESGRPIPPLPGLQPWPWAVNADGAAWYFDSKAVAVAWTAAAVARGVRQIDVGCMQINLQSHPQAFASLEDAFDPGANASYGALFLKQLQADALGNWYVATGYYHSRTPILAADYRERVAAIAEGRMPPASLGVPLYMRAIQQGSLRIVLPGGGVMRINLNRQPAARGHRRMTACQVAAVLGPFMASNARSACSGRAAVVARQGPAG